MNDTQTDTKTTDLRFRCLSMALGLEQGKHQHTMQTWMHDGRSGTPPTPPHLVDCYDLANEIWNYISNVGD